MNFGQTLRTSYRELQQGWNRWAESAFGKAPSTRDEMAGGEFISAFISEGGLNFPRAAEKSRRD